MIYISNIILCIFFLILYLHRVIFILFFCPYVNLIPYQVLFLSSPTFVVGTSVVIGLWHPPRHHWSPLNLPYVHSESNSRRDGAATISRRFRDVTPSGRTGSPMWRGRGRVGSRVFGEGTEFHLMDTLPILDDRKFGRRRKFKNG